MNTFLFGIRVGMVNTVISITVYTMIQQKTVNKKWKKNSRGMRKSRSN